jgi:hypothetical protein
VPTKIRLKFNIPYPVSIYASRLLDNTSSVRHSLSEFRNRREMGVLFEVFALHVGKLLVLLTFTAVPLTLFLSRQCHRCHNYQYFGRFVEIIWKKVPLVYVYIWLKWIRIHTVSAGPGCQIGSGSTTLIFLLDK